MRLGFRSQLERLELKYLVDETQCSALREDLQPYCERDPHTPSPHPDDITPRGYPIHSLYLDTPTLEFHRAKERGDPDRFKLRARSYGAGTPAVLELKQRSSDVVQKMRVSVAPESVADAAIGLGKPMDADHTAQRYLDRFARYVITTGAGPTLMIRYEREAFRSVVDEYARVTFDRRIEALRTWDWDLEPTGPWCSLDDHASTRKPVVVLEIKCQSFIPPWVTDLIRRHDLRRQSFSKYSVGIHLAARRDGIRSLPRRCGGALEL